MNKSQHRHEAEVTSLQHLSGNEYEDYWDEFYSSDEYAFLEDPSEIGRMGIIAEYLTCNDEITTILDVGCGVGNLCRLLPDDLKTGYMGIDVSQRAVQIARTKYPDCAFIQCKAELVNPQLTFDAIIVSELLYYVNYVNTLTTLKHNLSDHGVFICSLYKAPSSASILEHIRLHYNVLHDISITSITHDLEWNVCCFKMR